MDVPDAQTEISFDRARCYGCHRPIDLCFCDRIPSVANKTNILVLQHLRERFHPFNTARILAKSLQKFDRIINHVPQLDQTLRDMIESGTLGDRIGLLYPGDSAQLLHESSCGVSLDTLVVLDGTWHHTKTMMRDIPQLQSLPRYRLAPEEPSRYGIRREPHRLFLSTLESTVAALKCLEPETTGLTDLLSAFDAMVTGQMTHPRSSEGRRRNLRRERTILNIPRQLLHSIENIVVVYGESSPGFRGDRYEKKLLQQSGTLRPPVYWCAERIATGERFECAVAPIRPLPDSFFQHTQIPRATFDCAIPVDTFLNRWKAFLKPTDEIAYYYSNIAKLLSAIDTNPDQCIHLKSIKLSERSSSQSLEELLDAIGTKSKETHFAGRAGLRMANTMELLMYVHRFAQSELSNSSRIRRTIRYTNP